MKTNAARILDRLGIPYVIRTYPVDENRMGAVAAAEKLGLPAQQVFKTLVARVPKVDVVLACVPGGADLDLKALGAAAGGKRAELVPIDEIRGITGYIRGGVSPIGTRRTLPVYLDSSARDWPVISISAGIRGCQILIAPQDLVRAVGATVGEIAKPPG